MLRSRGRRQQSSAELTNEKQIEEGSGIGIMMSSTSSNNALSSPNISIASGTADDSSDYLLRNNSSSSSSSSRSPFSNFGRKSISSSHSPHLQSYKSQQQQHQQRKDSYSSLFSRVGGGGYTVHQQPRISIQELKQFHASGGGGGVRSPTSSAVTRVLLLMLVISLGCGIFLVQETVHYRDNIATLETELGAVSSLPVSSSYAYSSSSRDIGGVKAGGGGGGDREQRDSLATIARYLDATYGGVSGGMSITSSVVNKNIIGNGGNGGGSRFDDTTTTVISSHSNNNDHNGYDSNLSPDNNNNNNEIVQHLQSQKESLQSQINNYEIRLNHVREGMTALQTQATYLQTTELINQQDKLTNLAQELVKSQHSIEEYKSQFLTIHHDRIISIVQKGEPLGQGHALKQRLVLQTMETVDDYLKYIDERELSLWNKIDKLVNKMKRDSRIEAIEWFGQGPHYVEMEIEYPEYQSTILESKHWPRARGIVRYEMAPLDLMPVAVNLFLQQVHHGLWDGCSFVVNAVHIIQAGPHRHNGQGGYNHNIPELYDQFISKKLDVMPFQEYSTDYPHVKYTLGFSGRPSGPDFYINKIDNSISHGPGGQEHHDLHEEADPCFAKIVSGVETLEDIYKIPIYSRDGGYGNMIVNPVIILNAKVISSNTNHELLTLLMNDEQSMQAVERPHDVNNNDNTNDNEEQQSEIVEQQQQQQQQAVEQALQEELELSREHQQQQ